MNLLSITETISGESVNWKMEVSAQNRVKTDLVYLDFFIFF